MNQNVRIKEVRKALHLSQTDFGERIGVSRSVIKNIDNNLVEAKPLLIEHLCKIFNVNENWLKTGEGDMFNETTESYLEKIAHKYKLSDLEKTLISKFIALNGDQRKAILAYINSVIDEMIEKRIKEQGH